MVGLLPAHEKVLAALRQSGLRVGDQLPGEPELALRLGMSRQSVREALVAMQALGLVTGRQGSRRRLSGFDATVFGEQLAWSLEPNPDNLLQMLQVRRVLEHSFLPVSSQSLGRRTLGELRALSDAMVALAAGGHTFLPEDEQFHRLLYSGLRNSALDGIIRGFWMLFRQAPGTITTTANLQRTAGIHRSIVDALEAGDIELAVHRLDAHFYDVQSRIISSRQEAGTGAELRGANN